MHLIQMGIAQVVIVICNHFISFAFKAHALAASAACNSKAPVCSLNRHFTIFIGAYSYIIFQHIFLEQGIPSLFGLLACQARMVMLLALTAE